MEQYLMEMEQAARAISILVQMNTNIPDSTMVTISAFYPLWNSAERYGNGQVVRWGLNKDGKWLLYRTTSGNIQPNGPEPGTPGAPYRLIG